MNFALEVSGLTCIRGQRILFRSLNISLQAGTLLSVEGPNGAGKTSLLRLIAGFLRASAGTVRLRTDAGELEDAEERGGAVGWLGHQDAVKPQMSVSEQLAFFARLYGSAVPLEAAITDFGLGALKDLPGQFLSAGQRRRVALARLKLTGRPLWLMDEPLAALDTAGKALVAGAITAHCAAGGIVLAATHEPLGLSGRTLRLGEAS